MGKTKTILKVIFALLVVMLMFTNISLVFGSYTDGDKKTYTPQEFTKKADGKTEGGKIVTTGTGVTNVKSVGGKIVGLIRVVGTIAAVGVLIILGIRYMMGSAEERAEYKKTLFPYFIGAVLAFAATNLTQVIYSWAVNL